MKDELRKKITSDIKRSGFLSELLVATDLVKSKWEVRNCVTFLDEDKSVMREVDVMECTLMAGHNRLGQPGGVPPS